MNKNSEGYADPTPGGAYSSMRRAKRHQTAAVLHVHVSKLITVIKQLADMYGFEVVGRITLRDKATGKEYR